jgi:hypothetical protein
MFAHMHLSGGGVGLSQKTEMGIMAITGAIPIDWETHTVPCLLGAMEAQLRPGRLVDWWSLACMVIGGGPHP